MTMEIREARRADSTQFSTESGHGYGTKVQVERCHPDPNTVRLNTARCKRPKNIIRMGRDRRRRRGSGAERQRERAVYKCGTVENECVVCIILWIMYFWGDITLSSIFLPPLASYFQSSIFLFHSVHCGCCCSVFGGSGGCCHCYLPETHSIKCSSHARR